MNIGISAQKWSRIESYLGAAVSLPKRLVKTVMYIVGKIFNPVLRPFEKGANRIARQLNPLESLVKCVEDFKPVLTSEIENFTSAATTLADSGEQLSNTLQDIAYKTAYLATSVMGLYIYDMAIRRQGLQDPIGSVQQVIGLSLALGAGAQWGYSVAKSHDLI